MHVVYFVRVRLQATGSCAGYDRVQSPKLMMCCVRYCVRWYYAIDRVWYGALRHNTVRYGASYRFRAVSVMCLVTQYDTMSQHGVAWYSAIRRGVARAHLFLLDALAS